MKHIQKTLINSMVGALVGAIFTVLVMGWPLSPHGVITRDWTGVFLVVGIAWGGVCGAVIGLIRLVVEMSSAHRLVAGVVTGGISGAIFWLILEVPFWSFETAAESLEMIVWGLLVGMALGSVSVFIVVKVRREMKGSRVGRFLRASLEQEKGGLGKTLSVVSRVVIGAIVGSSLALLSGAIMIVPTERFFHEIEMQLIIIYALPVVSGCIGAVYGFAKPLKSSCVQEAAAGLLSGLVFGLVASFHFVALIVVPPALASQNLGDVSSSVLLFWVFAVPTMILALATGMVGEMVNEKLA